MSWTRYPLVPLSEILHQIDRRFSIDDSTTYNRVGVRWYGRGAFIRETCPGMNIARKKQYLIKDGDVVYNKLFAWKGAFAVAKGVDNGIVSDKFPLYNHDAHMVDLDYIRFFFPTHIIANQAKSFSKGAASISKFTLNPKDFLKLSIPLPKLEIQQLLVKRLKFLISRIMIVKNDFSFLQCSSKRLRTAILSNAFRGELLEQQRTRELEDKIISPVHAITRIALNLKEIPKEWAWIPIGEITNDVISGFASGEKNVPEGAKHLRMNNIGTDGFLNLSLVRTVPKALAKPRYRLKIGDILFCHTNSATLVGKTTLFDIPDDVYYFSNHLTRLRCDESRLLPKWLRIALLVLWQSRYFETKCKKWVNQATITKKTLLSAEIPVPPLSEQRYLIEAVDSALSKLASIDAAADVASKKMEMLTQAILARAFQGELFNLEPQSSVQVFEDETT